MIEIEDVTKRYDGVAVVDAVTMTVEPRTLTAVVGTSGSGKTTLLRMINRLVEPSSGTIKLDGERNDTLPSYELRRRIGYVIQGYGLFPHRTVAENIATVPRLVGWKKQDIDDRVDELLTLFQLEPDAYRHRYPHELSGGQQQRVGVARALAGEPGLMLMDEPFGALDPVTRDQLGEAYRALHDRLGPTTIMVTHDMAEALLLADRILVMSAGRIVADGTPAAMLSGAAGEEARELIAVPQRQMAKLRALEGEA